MNKRHPLNTNLTLIHGDEWNGLPLLRGNAPFVEQYLDRTHKVMTRAVQSHRRVTAIRFDLRIPADFPEPDSAVISRFFEALKDRIMRHQLRRARQGKRVHSSDVGYVWVREQSSSHHRHYHCCIFLNGDAYRFLGSFKAIANKPSPGQENMALRIRSAWASALRCSWGKASGLAHFPDNRVYHIDVNADDYVSQVVSLFKRLSYFAKMDTKLYGGEGNSFGSSRV